MDTKNAVITTSPKSFWRKAEKFRSMYENLKKYIIQKNDLHKDPIGSVNAVLTTRRNLPCSLRERYKI